MASTCGNWQKYGQQNDILGLFVTHMGQWCHPTRMMILQNMMVLYFFPLEESVC